jgi:heat shock protein HslJ
MFNFRSIANRYFLVAALLLAALALATGCSNSKTMAQGGDTLPLTEEALKNAEYSGIYEEIIRLTDGRYEGEPFVEGGASRPTVTFTGAYALGDLNGDGLDDAAVVLVENSGGSGSFFYLALVLNQDGNPENVVTQLLGDRAQVESVTIDGAEIAIKAMAHAPGDPMCCPTQEVDLTYRFDEGQLVEVAEEMPEPDVEDAAETEIVDITWQWTELVETTPAGQSLVPNPKNYTLVLRSDGTYQVQADCNLSSGNYTLEGERLTLLPGPTTLAECGPDSLYDLYLAKLGSVESLSLEDGRLVLHLRDGAGNMAFRNAGLTDEAAGETTGTDITGTIWMWKETSTPTGVTSVDDSEKYTLELLPDGRFQFSADCNVGSGAYIVGEGHLSLEIGPMTRAACPSGSLSDQFIKELETAAIYFLKDGNLYIDLKLDSGTMRFAPVG